MGGWPSPQVANYYAKLLHARQFFGTLEVLVLVLICPNIYVEMKKWSSIACWASWTWMEVHAYMAKAQAHGAMLGDDTRTNISGGDVTCCKWVRKAQGTDEGERKTALKRNINSLLQIVNVRSLGERTMCLGGPTCATLRGPKLAILDFFTVHGLCMRVLHSFFV